MTSHCAKVRVSLCGSLAAISLLAMIPSRALASAVTFSTLSLDSSVDSFTDASSGIVFSNPTSADGNAFVVEQSDSNASLPNMTPGAILTGNGTTDLTTDENFAFTMTFPNPVTQLNMDMAYIADPNFGGSIELDGFDAEGNLLTSQVQSFQTDGLQEYDLSFSSAVGVSSLNIVPTGIAEGFGNISTDDQSAITPVAVPEPISLLPIAVGCALIGRRRRASRN